MQLTSYTHLTSESVLKVFVVKVVCSSFEVKLQEEFPSEWLLKMTTVQRVLEYYKWSMQDGDPKTADWPLIATPWPTFSFITLYLFIVKVGPKIMQNRKAYSLREVLIVYNFAMVILSAWMVYEFIASVVDIPNFDYFCEPMHYVRGDKRLNRLARICYIYWLSKFVEALDTFFFILRKKNNQVSFLHVYHHAFMCFLWWMICKYIPGERRGKENGEGTAKKIFGKSIAMHRRISAYIVDRSASKSTLLNSHLVSNSVMDFRRGFSYFGAAVNCFVHVVMYAYYGLSAIGPQMQPYLWWKAHITKLQLTQFVVLLTYWSNVPLRCKCVVGFHQYLVLFTQWSFVASLLVLFSNFYIQSYLKTNKAKKDIKKFH
ncbi:very long chain fatty acid elongase 7-like [Montipora foliosa]|uniref:very long chain fatty acid elongase 7-like n=1 Tax=Montipora foliosa TaxID=591990 RepID=UPI0035F10EFD